MARPTSFRLAVLAALATTGCTVQITNPLVNVDPNVLPTVAPTRPPQPLRPTDPDGNGCDELGAGSPSIVFPMPEPKACPAIYPPPPGCEPEAMRGVYGEFAGLRAPAVFKKLQDAEAVRERLRAVYYMDRPRPASTTAQPMPGAAVGVVPGREPLAAQQRVLLRTPPAVPRTLPAPDYLWSCLQAGYPELCQAFLDGENAVTPPVEPTPEPWFPEPCLYGPSQTVTLSGAVFDGQGTPFPGEVEVRVATADFSFNAKAEVVDGQWQVSGAPAGARLQVTAVHTPSGEARRRFVVPQAAFVDCGQEGFATVNFGGPTSDADPLGHRYAMGVSAPDKATSRTALTLRVFDVAGQPVPGAMLTLRALGDQQGYKRSLPAGAVAGKVPVPLAFRGLQQERDEPNGMVATSPVARRPAIAIASATFDDVPAEVPLEVLAEAQGFQSVVRIVQPLTATRPHIFSLGGPATRQDPVAPQYALVPIVEQPVEARVTVGGVVFRQDSGKPVGAGVVRLVTEGGDRDEAPLSQEGTYTFKGVKPRTVAVLTVEAPGFEPMRRKVRIGARPELTFNFGGTSTKTDPLAPSFGLVERIAE
jgi:hypothetical protein